MRIQHFGHSVSYCMAGADKKAHLFSPSLKFFRLASSARILVDVSSELMFGSVFDEDEGDEIVDVKDTL
jgi:hypothetical protein